MNLISSTVQKLRNWWCDLFHKGGYIMRDPAGQINWQCETCGRWADPVPAELELRTTNSAIREKGGQ